MKKICFLMLCMLFSVLAFAQQDQSPLVGTWNYTASDAPYGYQKGQVVFVETEGVLGGKIIIQGYEIPLKEIKQNGNTYTSTTYIDGAVVDANFVWDGEKLNGKCTADGMQMPVLLVKVTEEE